MDFMNLDSLKGLWIVQATVFWIPESSLYLTLIKERTYLRWQYTSLKHQWPL